MYNEVLKVRRHKNTDSEATDHRLPWAMDVDRILHSRAYTRYIDKTQVFYLLKNEHITHRVLHVQMVSRIARTVGRDLQLNEDLIEAIALGHDVGHPPFGHEGEVYLSELCVEAGLGPFVHSVMGVRFLSRLEKKGRGLNLTLGTLDGILMHDGESDRLELRPTGPSTFAELDRRTQARLSSTVAEVVSPMSAEGCLVRLCDSISYVGRDLEDAIEVGLVKREDLPQSIEAVLGNTNGQIIYTLVDDLRHYCLAHPGIIAFSTKIGEILNELKNFNSLHIYHNPDIKVESPKIKRLYALIFQRLIQEFESGQSSLAQVRDFLDYLDDEYPLEHTPAEMARDCLAAMTDEFFLRLANELFIPGWRTRY